MQALRGTALSAASSTDGSQYVVVNFYHLTDVASPNKGAYQGCCCTACVEAPRLLRPLKDQGYYGAWGNYSDGRNAERAMAEGRGSRRLTRRRQRMERLREKNREAKEERMARRSMVKAALRALEDPEHAQDPASPLEARQQSANGQQDSAPSDDRSARLAELRKRLARTKLAADAQVAATCS
ncbi:hypothetical protein WJX72_009661 [[Myrmecia] bisecta]|uniref:BZIP domain-containing protein n=1 Tax=[Myrmecia] bisecta TaxID=41462 RepID=A0AAW1QC00_9CHLO